MRWSECAWFKKLTSEIRHYNAVKMKMTSHIMGSGPIPIISTPRILWYGSKWPDQTKYVEWSGLWVARIKVLLVKDEHGYNWMILMNFRAEQGRNPFMNENWNRTIDQIRNTSPLVFGPPLSLCRVSTIWSSFLHGIKNLLQAGLTLVQFQLVMACGRGRQAEFSTPTSIFSTLTWLSTLTLMDQLGSKR